MWNTFERGTLESQVFESIRRRLPPGWRVESRGGQRALVLRLSSPDNRWMDLPVMAKKDLLPRGIPALLIGISHPVLVMSPYLSARYCEMLTEQGASFADGTGNVRIVVSTPAVFLDELGAERDPKRTPRSLQSLRSRRVRTPHRYSCIGSSGSNLPGNRSQDAQLSRKRGTSHTLRQKTASVLSTA
jgi:hypothetical protein